MAEKQMCLGCEQRPAVSSNGTVPLCAVCIRLTKDSQDFKKRTGSEAPAINEAVG